MIAGMKELQLKYGCNPNQKPARVYMENGDLPISVLNGRPGYINLLDALNGWQLVRELKAAAGLPAATSFKHVSPAGAAVGRPLSDTLRKVYCIDDSVELSPLACAYDRARGADRMSSFGDFIALSDTCDKATALLIKKEVSDGIIAPGYDDDALEILKAKKKGGYCVLQIDPSYEPEALERKQVFGITFEQGHNFVRIDDACLQNIVTQNSEDAPSIPRSDKKTTTNKPTVVEPKPGQNSMYRAGRGGGNGGGTGTGEAHPRGCHPQGSPLAHLARAIRLQGVEARLSELWHPAVLQAI